MAQIIVVLEEGDHLGSNARAIARLIAQAMSDEIPIETVDTRPQLRPSKLLARSELAGTVPV